jgi:repressor LexA
MMECGILDGDLLAVHRTQEVHNGDIIVARVDDEVTVKRLQKNRSKHLITLLPENAAYRPIEVDLRHQAFSIEGLMVGIIRH